MARRRAIKPTALIHFLLFVGLLWLPAKLLQDLGRGSNSVALHVLIAVSIAVGVYIVIRAFTRFMTRLEVLHQTKVAVSKSLDSLIRRRAQLVQKDAYGQPRIDKWQKEIEYFVNRQIIPSLTTRQRKALARNYAAIEAAIERRVEAAGRRQPAFQTFSDDMTPSEFEAFCAEELRRAGWDARVTLQSRDQGVDVIAERNNVRVVIQCKLYSRPVGNKAVQEVVAAKAHERAHYGVVVSNASYTLAAQQLGATNRVLLLHYRDLRSLDGMLSKPENR
jgi:HJR/Mrr/RecB family endonuclease